MAAYRLVSLNQSRTGNGRSDSGKQTFISTTTKMKTSHVQASLHKTNLAGNSGGYCTIKTNFLYDFCFLELLISLCDISYCFQVHQGYSLPMLLLNSFCSSSNSNKLVPNNLSERITVQKKNTSWKLISVHVN